MSDKLGFASALVVLADWDEVGGLYNDLPLEQHSPFLHDEELLQRVVFLLECDLAFSILLDPCALTQFIDLI